MKRIADLEPRLGPPAPRDKPHPAAVAVVLRDGEGGVEALLMRRAERAGDRWSGDVSFPGGFAHGDEGPTRAAQRETHEELGLELGEPLGALPDLPGPPWTWVSPFTITPLVFALNGDPPLTLEQSEVVSARWVPLATLLDPANRRDFWWVYRPWRRLPVAMPVRMPKVNVGDYDVWGLTLQIVQSLGG